MKNKTMQEAARTMLNEANLSYMVWRETFYIVVYILNTGQPRVNNDKTPYELWYGWPAIIKHLKIFGRKCYIKKDDNDLGKYDSITDEGIFLGYSSTRKAYRCYNKRLNKIVESANVKVEETRSKELKSQSNE